MKDKWIIIPAILVPLVFILGGLAKTDYDINKRQKRNRVEEVSVEKQEISKTEELIYENNLNDLIEARRLSSAYQLLENYKKDYPESTVKQDGYQKQIYQIRDELINNYNNALKRTYLKGDEVQRTKFRMANIQSKTTPKNLIVPYLGYSGDTPYIRFRIMFYGDNGWLFFKKAIFRVDDSLFEYSFKYDDINRQVIYASEVIETLDIDPSTEQLDMLRKIVKSNKTILRLQGDDYVEDRTIGDKEKQAINDILIIYDYENNPYINMGGSKPVTQEIKEY